MSDGNSLKMKDLGRLAHPSDRTTPAQPPHDGQIVTKLTLDDYLEDIDANDGTVHADDLTSHAPKLHHQQSLTDSILSIVDRDKPMASFEITKLLYGIAQNDNVHAMLKRLVDKGRLSRVKIGKVWHYSRV